ncbi:MAG: maleylpyruvate isomerase N-terminal domain-containing protein [Acidimicrobiales bacterium]
MSDTEVAYAKEAIAAARRGRDNIAELAGSMEGVDLLSQSGAGDWTVAKVLSHMGSGAEIGLATLTAGKADPSSNQAVWARWDAMSPDEKAESYILWSGRHIDGLEALDDDALANMRVDVGYLPEPINIAFLTELLLSEVGLHGWDVDVAFERTSAVRQYTVPYGIEVMTRFAGLFAQPLGKTGKVEVLTEDTGGEYVIDFTTQGISMAAGRAEGAEASAAMSAEAFLRLLSGRLAPIYTPPSVIVAGSFTLDDLRQAFPGY